MKSRTFVPRVILTGPSPCFNYRECKSYSTCEMDGKSLCEACAAKRHFTRFPLRPPDRAPLIQRVHHYREMR